MTWRSRSRTTVAPPKRRSNGRRATVAPYRIRPASASDIGRIHEIERSSFADPWSAADFHSTFVSAVTFLVAEAEAGGVIGYVIGRHVIDEGEILNLGVAPDARRHGIARSLVVALLEAFQTAGVQSVFLEVRESNHAARQLYDAFGFAVVGRRVQYYRRPVEDAIVLRSAISAG